jgi:hypothetical protein
VVDSWGILLNFIRNRVGNDDENCGISHLHYSMLCLCLCFVYACFPLAGIAEEDDVVEGQEPKPLAEDDEDEKCGDGDNDDVEQGGQGAPDSPSGRNELNQFDDVDLSAPDDYEAQASSTRAIV